ncbi:MAG TPA: thioredoxin [Terrimicrobiaceae bacterium]
MMHPKKTLEPDERGLVRSCPQCGQLNRLLYERLGNPFRCSKCKTELSPPSDPIEVPGTVEFDALLSKSALRVLVDFWAPWCGPCKMVAPELVKVAAQGADRWLVVKVNTEDLPVLAARFGIRAIPTLLLFNGGLEVARQAGALSAPAILQFIQRTQ